MVDFSLSMSHLLLVDGFKQAVEANDIQTVNKILFENGMEVSKKYSIRTIRHRNLQGKEVFCPRFEGQERIDNVWTKSGAASLDAIIANSKDPHMRRELRAMSHQVQQDRAWEE